LSPSDNISAKHLITSFACDQAELIFNGTRSKKLPSQIQDTARRKLRVIHRAKDLGDLRASPGNRLEQLKGDRQGQHSIRINDQWRICFRWQDGNATEVEITDYH
jgi:proteic killer suppression protein